MFYLNAMTTVRAIVKLINIEQGSPEWHEMRRTKIGSSDAPSIMGVGYKSRAKLMEEKWKPTMGYTNANMQRGKDVEPLARAMVSKLRGTTYQPVVAQSSEIEWQMASLDGWDGFEFTEIKCPGDETFQKVKNGDIPMDYYWQIQHECCVMNTSFGWLDVVKAKWIPENSEWVIEDHIATKIAKEEGSICELIHQEWEFHEKMINYELPEDAILDRTDGEFLDAIAAYKKICDAIKEAEELKKICREGIIYLAGEQSCRGGGMTVSRFYKPGAVDYSAVPELKGVDLTSYRKEGSMIWRIA
jgi:putative phage-type endonuclease